MPRESMVSARWMDWGRRILRLDGGLSDPAPPLQGTP